MATLHIEVSSEDKARWVRAAQAHPAGSGPGLAHWVIERLNAAAQEPLRLRFAGTSETMTWGEYLAANVDQMSALDARDIHRELFVNGFAIIAMPDMTQVIIERVL